MEIGENDEKISTKPIFIIDKLEDYKGFIYLQLVLEDRVMHCLLRDDRTFMITKINM